MELTDHIWATHAAGMFRNALESVQAGQNALLDVRGMDQGEHTRLLDDTEDLIVVLTRLVNHPDLQPVPV